eukprot:15471659-Alexandrium_andersonii.AAC.1
MRAVAPHAGDAAAAAKRGSCLHCSRRCAPRRAVVLGMHAVAPHAGDALAAAAGHVQGRAGGATGGHGGILLGPKFADAADLPPAGRK